MLDINRQIGHDVKLKAPFYASGGGTQLHRYMETDFVGRFQQDLSRRNVAGLQDQAWQIEDRFGNYKDRPTLRQAIHRTFYMMSVEVACSRLGEPALEPQKITSAGFVIRRVGGSRDYGWMVADGEPLGWQPIESEDRDPDIYRRICRNGRLKTTAVEPSYSGEEIHPLHPTTVYDENSKRHTLLFGYLPLAGNYYLRKDSKESPFEATELAKLGKEQYWPFGTRDRTYWRTEDAMQVNYGTPTTAFYYLLRTLVNRYHIGDANLSDNDLLEETLKGIYFYSPYLQTIYAPSTYMGIYLPSTYYMMYLPEFSDANRAFYQPFRLYSLYDYLVACFNRGARNPLITWLVAQDKKLEGLRNPQVTLDPLPQKPDVASSGYLYATLYLSQGDGEELRALMTERLSSAALNQAREIPIAKFQQGSNDVYRVIPFVRHKDAQGNERITWGKAVTSIDFRVASPLDPEASRPSLIPMPSLGDLRRGLAKGASFLVPSDTMEMFNALKLNKGVSEETAGESGPGLGIQWICSFSIPVITLVAMILLMVMIALLNIVFWWMPWVRICLPFPKMK